MFKVKTWGSILLLALLLASTSTAFINLLPAAGIIPPGTIIIYRSADANAMNALIAKHPEWGSRILGTESVLEAASNNIVLVGGWLALPTYYAQYFPQVNSQAQLKDCRYLITQVARTGGTTVTAIMGWTTENTVDLCKTYPSYPSTPSKIVIYCSTDTTAVQVLALHYSAWNTRLLGTETPQEVANDDIVLVGGWLALSTYYQQYFPAIKTQAQLKDGKYLIVFLVRPNGTVVTALIGWTAQDTQKLCSTYPNYPLPQW